MSTTRSNVVSATPTGSLFPLAVSSDDRWLEYANGDPLHVNGDAAWSIMVELGESGVDTYLADRAAKSVNLIMVSAIEHKYCDNADPWKNAAGEDPFGSTLGGGEFDFTDPNEAYWTHVDYVVDACYDLDIAVFMIAAYIGFQHADDGWSAAVEANGTSGMGTYGTFLAQRYASYPNVVFVVGGDYGPVFGGTDLSSEYAALAAAIQAEGNGHLISAHAEDGQAGREAYGTTYIDFDTAYSVYEDHVGTVHSEVRASYQATAPTLPVLMMESGYGNEASRTDIEVMKIMWHGILAGAFGHITGSAPVWYFGVDASHPANSFATTGGLSWTAQLNKFGAQYLEHVAALQASRDLSTLTPDYSHTYVTSGYGTEGANYAPVMAGSQMLVAFTPGNALTVDKSQFASATFNVRWYDPTDGTVSGATTSSFGSGSEVFTPPDSNDWVLLLDDQALGLGAP